MSAPDSMYEFEQTVLAGAQGRFACIASWVPVSPALAFEAISTGEGISRWYLPARVTKETMLVADYIPGLGSAVSSDVFTVTEEVATQFADVTVCTAPNGGSPGEFSYVEKQWLGPGEMVPDWETHFTVIPHSLDGIDGCTVTLRSGFDTDGELAAATVDDTLGSWRHTFTSLVHYLTHHADSHVTTILTGVEGIECGVKACWSHVLAQLRPTELKVGANFRHGEVAGKIADIDTNALSVVLSAPVDAIVNLSAFADGSSATDADTLSGITARVYTYGECEWSAEKWTSWMTQLSSGAGK